MRISKLRPAENGTQIDYSRSGHLGQTNLPILLTHLLYSCNLDMVRIICRTRTAICYIRPEKWWISYGKIWGIFEMVGSRLQWVHHHNGSHQGNIWGRYSRVSPSESGVSSQHLHLPCNRCLHKGVLSETKKNYIRRSTYEDLHTRRSTK